MRVERCIYLQKNKYYRVCVGGAYIATCKTLDEAVDLRDTYFLDKDKYSKRTVIVEGLTDRLNESVAKSGLSLKEISAMTGINTGNLCHYFNRGINPKIDNLAKLAVCLNVSTDWLLGISQERTRQ